MTLRQSRSRSTSNGSRGRGLTLSDLASSRSRSGSRMSMSGHQTQTKATRNAKVLVKRMITNTLEKKHLFFSSNTLNIGVYGSAQFNTASVKLTPNITTLPCIQGTGQGDRIGNSITVRSARLKLILSPQPYDSGANAVPRPMMVRVLLLSFKRNPGTQVTSITSLFQAGDSSSAPTTGGSLSDMVSEINRDEYSVYYDKVFKVGHSSITGTGNIAANQFHSNNDFPMAQFIKIDLTNKVPHNLKYSDAAAADPNNRVLGMIVLTAAADGSVMSGTTTVPLKLNYAIDYTYTDA